MIRVLLVEDRPRMRERLERYLDTESDVSIVGSVGDVKAAIERIEALEPDVVLVDLEMPGSNGLRSAGEIATRFSTTKVLVLGNGNSEANVESALRVGAKGYLLKATPEKELTNAIRAAHWGYVQLEATLLEKILEDLATSSEDRRWDRLQERVDRRLEKIEHYGGEVLELRAKLEQVILERNRNFERHNNFLLQLNRLQRRVYLLERDLSRAYRSLSLIRFSIVLATIAAIVIGGLYFW